MVDIFNSTHDSRPYTVVFIVNSPVTNPQGVPLRGFPGENKGDSLGIHQRVLVFKLLFFPCLLLNNENIIKLRITFSQSIKL
jgi:hypothetical protein